MPLIKIKNASVIYNEGLDNQVNALLDASLEVKPQEYIIFSVLRDAENQRF